MQTDGILWQKLDNDLHESQKSFAIETVWCQNEDPPRHKWYLILISALIMQDLEEL